MSSAIPDTELRAYSENARDKVVIITGGAMGLGKQAGEEFIRAGSKVVVGDLKLAAAEATVAEWKERGGDAVAIQADVTKWADQVALFKFAIDTYGRVDVVVANAGVGEIGQFDPFGEIKQKEPTKPVMVTPNVNMTGVLYTARLAMFHFKKNPATHDKTLILIGSVASFEGLPMAPMYSHTKHAVLGMMRSLSTSTSKNPSTLPNIRVCSIHPWFADTAILEKEIRMVLRGLPWTYIARVGGAIFRAATEPSPAKTQDRDLDMQGANGAAYLIPDDGEVFCLRRENVDLLSAEGCYAPLRERIAAQAKNPVGPPTVL